MNNPLENLRQLTEAVRMAGADIAPTYIEYVQLAFAIANDCGEAGRNDFLSLCSLSSKYDEKNAQALFSNALHAGNRIPSGRTMRSEDFRQRRLPQGRDNGDSRDTPGFSTHVRAI